MSNSVSAAERYRRVRPERKPVYLAKEQGESLGIARSVEIVVTEGGK